MIGAAHFARNKSSSGALAEWVTAGNNTHIAYIASRAREIEVYKKNALGVSLAVW